ncbi:hypothetical protein HXZ94_07580 [Empedobacter falsenii]|uniref:hypothetical protein n=1 Tax=Empedobacter falsenii TaxID=343874 RepID=UPI0025791E4B|nr:hypothetical protein [Empedobacter falsenii]MDM1298362.1 hypothetical protein [Empedobacter falsenii]MDM1318081.1 hypothetical protein [Empedobacter falsenii]
MRKLVSLIMVLGSFVVTNAQTESETLNWLKENKPTLDHVNCQAYNLYGDYFEITDDYVKLYNDEKQYCKIYWKDVTKVTTEDNFFYLISNKKVDDKNVRLKMLITNTPARESFVNALRHMVDLKTTIAKYKLF